MDIKVKLTNDYIVGNGELAFAGHLIRKTEFVKRANRVKLSESPNPEIKHGNVFASYIGLCVRQRTTLII